METKHKKLVVHPEFGKGSMIAPEGWKSERAAIAREVCDGYAQLFCAAPEMALLIRDMLGWAESVEGHEVARGITKGGMFAEARALLAKLKG
jgi:hypothetical protein